MARHEVEMRIPTTKVVMHADVVFEIRSDDEKLGELRVSQGTIDWYPRHAQNGTSLTWERFDQIMSDHR